MNDIENGIENQEGGDSRLSVVEGDTLTPQTGVRVVSSSDLEMSADTENHGEMDVSVRNHISGLGDVNQVYNPGTNALGTFGLTVLAGLDGSVDMPDSVRLVAPPAHDHVEEHSDHNGVDKKPETQVIEVLVYNDIISCGMCGKQFVEILDFLEHKSQHTISHSVHRCELCKEIYLVHSQLVEHYRSTHTLTHFGLGLEEPTEDMNIDTDLVTDAQTDVKSPEVRPPKLSSGKRDFQLSSGKRDFQLLVVNERGRTRLQCLQCEFKTLSKLAISKHMHDKHRLTQPTSTTAVPSTGRVMKLSAYERETSGGQRDVAGVYACESCDKIFSRLRYLRKHKETHRTDKKFLCDECGKSFKCKTYLTVHRRIHKSKLFKCNQCEFTSDVNAAIHAHRQIHNQGSVLCDICGFAYIDKSTLAKHKRVHDLSRPYACNLPGCAWRFKTEMMCKAHIRAHTTEGKFQCLYCGYVFRHKHHLQRHEAKLHGVKSRPHRTQTLAHLVSEEVILTDNKDMSAVYQADAKDISAIYQADAKDISAVYQALAEQAILTPPFE